MFDNDDDYDFNPNDSSKLSSLFGSTVFLNEELTNNLTYSAPKQPNNLKSPENPDKQSNGTKVLHIKVVSLWKSDKKTYKPMGKHGLAIIGATDLNVYEVIAYKHKTNTVFRAKVSKQFCFQQRKDNYSSLFDNNNQNWLVKFDNIEQQIEFGEVLKSFGAMVIMEASDEIKEDSKITKPELLPKPDVSVIDQDSDSTDSLNKAKILSRITKMGQQIVPKPLVAESDISDEYDGTSNKNKKFRKIKKLEQEDESQQLSLNTSTQMFPRSLVSIPQVPLYYSQQTMGDINSVFLAHNAEIKTSLNHISEKIDSLTSQKNQNSNNLVSKLKVLELQSENLQSELNKYKEKYSDLKNKYYSKLEEDNPNLETSLDISKLNDTVAELNLQLVAANDKIKNLDTLEEEIKNNNKDISEYQRIIETQKVSLEELNLFYQQFKNNTNMESNVTKLQETVDNVNEKLKDYELRFTTFELEKKEQLQKNQENASVLATLIKVHMNNMYQSILHTFDPDETYALADIQSVLAKNLKDTSLQMINGIKTKLQESKIKENN